MTTQFCWTSERQELVGKLVRRFAFDFDAVSNAFRDHLTSEGVDFSPNAMNPRSLRKVFAALDRKRAAPAGESSANSYDQGLGDTDAEGGCGLGDVSYGGWGSSAAKRASREQHADNPIQGALYTHDPGLTARGESKGSSFPGLVVQRDFREGCVSKESGRNEGTVEATAPPATDKSWSFDNFVEDQRRKEIQHDDQKEKLFLKEDRKLALQRQSLKQRHLPDSVDCVGDDPLAVLTTGCTATMPAPEDEEGSGTLLPRCHPCCREEPEENAGGDDAGASSPRCGGPTVAGPVRLELGMDAEVLEKILDEHEREFSLAAGGYAETDSELSRVLDELDEAAARGGNPARLLCNVRDQ
ncbi:unnamed protein product [Scytosiphon promiscuus]